MDSVKGAAFTKWIQGGHKVDSVKGAAFTKDSVKGAAFTKWIL